LFPYAAIAEVEEALQWTAERAPGSMPWFYQSTDRTETVYLPRGDQPEGLNLITAMGPDNRLALKVIDMHGELVHEWPVDWFDIWSDATHLPPQDVPQTRPGTHLHGTLLLPDGDILFNFEKLGMVRMGLCGEVRWKLPYQTHHSIHLDDNGDIWASGLKTHAEAMPEYPAHAVPVREQVIIKISPDGELLEEISVFDLLRDNGDRALLHMQATPLANTISGDSLHLNDVEVFPRNMAEGFFRHGDVLISLRNIHGIFVFDPDTRKIKYQRLGGFTRQHDPDFIDGDSLLIFDNNNIGPASFGQQSSILRLDVVNDELTTVYTGTAAEPFYTQIMGKQQLLANGHLLITDSVHGRGFEVDQEGNVVWEFINLVDDGVVGIVEEVQRLSPEQRQHFTGLTCGQ
jgi:hypothetical protein